MKKLFFVVIIALLATTLMAGTAAKLLRLEVINASGDTVYIKLTGKANGNFYYLTIPDGETKTFTIASDVYDRVTWACDGLMNKGTLIMTSNNRLKFTKCNTFPVNSGEPTMEKVAYFPVIWGFVTPWHTGCGDYKVIHDLKELFSPPYTNFVLFKATARYPNSWWSYWLNGYKQGCFWRYRY